MRNTAVSRKECGFTLTELLVSMAVSTIILLGVLSLLQVGANGYKQISNGISETSASRSATEWIQDDLGNIILQLPLSYGDGGADSGWDIAKGLYTTWEGHYSYGTYFPSEMNKGFPCDRLGFFILISKEEAESFDGKNIAHVLYFTAITKDTQSEDLSQDFSANNIGYSRKLFRYFTPPDRVFARLNLINPTQAPETTPRGLAAIPRGASFIKGTPKNDDADWGFPSDLSPAVLSLVANNIAQFTINLSGKLISLDGSTTTQILESFSQNYKTVDALKAEFPSGADNFPSNFHEVLKSNDTLGTHHFIPRKLDFQIKVCPKNSAQSLTAGQWDTLINGQYLGRDDILPTAVFFTKSLTL